MAAAPGTLGGIGQPVEFGGFYFFGFHLLRRFAFTLGSALESLGTGPAHVGCLVAGAVLLGERAGEVKAVFLQQRGEGDAASTNNHPRCILALVRLAQLLIQLTENVRIGILLIRGAQVNVGLVALRIDRQNPFRANARRGRLPRLLPHRDGDVQWPIDLLVGHFARLIGARSCAGESLGLEWSHGVQVIWLSMLHSRLGRCLRMGLERRQQRGDEQNLSRLLEDDQPDRDVVQRGSDDGGGVKNLVESEPALGGVRPLECVDDCAERVDEAAQDHQD